MNASVIKAASHGLLEPAEEAAEYITKAAGRVERTAARELPGSIPEIVEAVLSRFKWPTKVQVDMAKACLQLNILEDAYLAFLKMPSSAERRNAMKLFSHGYAEFSDSLETLRKSAATLSRKEDQKLLLDATKSMEEHAKLRQGPVEALGRDIAGAGHLVPESVIGKAAKRTVADVSQHMPGVLKRMEAMLLNASEKTRFPALSKLIGTLGGVENASLKEAIEKILRRMEKVDGKKLLKMSEDKMRSTLSNEFIGLQRNVQGKLGEGAAMVQPVAVKLRERAMERALSNEYGLVGAGWQKSSINDAVSVTALNGSTSKEFFDASDWLYRVEKPKVGASAEMDELAKLMESEMTTDLDGIAFNSFALESKAGNVGDIIDQFSKTSTRSVFGVVELPVPGMDRPGRFLIVPPPGFQTEVLLIAPNIPKLKNLPIDMTLAIGAMQISQKEFQDASRELVHLVALARSGR